MNTYLKRSLINLFHLGFIQLTNIALQLMLIPLVVSRVGIPANGLALTALSLAGIGGIIINFGTNQSLPKLLKSNESEPASCNISIKELLFVRIFLFILIAVLIFIVSFLLKDFRYYLVSILPLLFAEVVNPYAIFLGLEKLKGFNLGNLISRILALVLVFLLVNKTAQAPFVNVYVGISQAIVFLFLLMYLLVSRNIVYGKLDRNRILQFVKENYSLTASNLIVHFQQSVFLYALGIWSSGIVLGAYAIVDKLVWGGRMILIAISNALYPSAIEAHKISVETWRSFRRKVNTALSVILMITGTYLFFFSSFIAHFLSLSEAKELVSFFIKCISILPLIIGLNMLNVLELILENKYRRQMQLSILLLMLSFILSFLFVFVIPLQYAIMYLIVLESICLILYEKNRHYTS